MSEVARYNFDGEKNAHWILETDEGHFVKHEDYAALAQKMAATEQDEQNTLKERDAAEDALATMYEAVIGEAPEWSNIFGYDDAIETVEMTLSALQQRLDAALAENARMLSDYREIPEMRRIGAPLTPETDAILNEVRAEGAIACGVHLREWYDYQVESRAEEFAAQLRAGSAKGATND